MSKIPSSRTSLHLEPPRKSTELVDPGTRDLDSSDGENEYFSDAPEGDAPLSPLRSGQASPIPKTRVEKVDDTPSHGQIPGSPAYEQRLQDAVPDEIAIIPEANSSKRNSRNDFETLLSPGGSVVPIMVVEKVDPTSPSHGEVPGTPAYAQRQMDATPDLVIKVPEDGSRSPALSASPEIDTAKTTPRSPIPETVITRVDSAPAHGEVEGTAAYEQRRADAEPDVMERRGDVAGPPTLDRSAHRTHNRRKSSINIFSGRTAEGKDSDDGFGDDFDDFESGEEAGADDDFGDFDEGVREIASPQKEQSPPPSATEIPLPFPLLDFQELSSFQEIVEAAEIHLNAMFPSTSSEMLSSLPVLQAIPTDSPIFPSDRSRSLWDQLVTPPPLQPPNWTKSRIRRLFLVSLGVPVDLDEILPPSKQKKLVLPDINLGSPSRKSESERNIGSVARLKAEAANDSNASVDSTQSGSKSTSRRRPRGPLPPPELDLAAVKRLCATTTQKIDGSTDAELKSHVKELESMTEKTSEVLEYWLKRRDGAVKEKEAFEGVIENLVRHARRVRK